MILRMGGGENNFRVYEVKNLQEAMIKVLRETKDFDRLYIEMTSFSAFVTLPSNEDLFWSFEDNTWIYIPNPFIIESETQTSSISDNDEIPF